MGPPGCFAPLSLCPFVPAFSRFQLQRVPRICSYSRLCKRQRKGCSAVVVLPLVAEVFTVWVAAFAQRNILGRTVDAAPVHGESLRGTKRFAHLFYCCSATAEW